MEDRSDVNWWAGPVRDHQYIPAVTSHRDETMWRDEKRRSIRCESASSEKESNKTSRRGCVRVPAVALDSATVLVGPLLTH